MQITKTEEGTFVVVTNKGNRMMLPDFEPQHGISAALRHLARLRWIGFVLQKQPQFDQHLYF